MGAQHIGHFPRASTNSLAHFEHVHMCPHLQVGNERKYKVKVKLETKEKHTKIDEKFARITCTTKHQYGYHNIYNKFPSLLDPIWVHHLANCLQTSLCR